MEEKDDALEYGAGKPDYPQKLKVPEGYEKRNENRNL